MENSFGNTSYAEGFLRGTLTEHLKGIGRMFYVVSPQETLYAHKEQVPNFFKQKFKTLHILTSTSINKETSSIDSDSDPIFNITDENIYIVWNPPIYQRSDQFGHIRFLSAAFGPARTCSAIASPLI
ncbi:hypothetical protein EVAR_96767_1 [Eumeta japonica]|uniref:Uncharacterized protein n=1 Tax=Eumeta variegata TaxID=151549 RepID=A0A4C1WSP5_EUMVA|nr:hypothetical protein EVAR_96767_1 [Eumeta japonica]